jgi:hypothetical protein
MTTATTTMTTTETQTEIVMIFHSSNGYVVPGKVKGSAVVYVEVFLVITTFFPPFRGANPS